MNFLGGLQLRLRGIITGYILGGIFQGTPLKNTVVYVTAPLPYVFLTVLVIRGITLPGSSIGLEFYLKPKWEKLLDFTIWTRAAVQVFYSLGPAWGGLITMSSYNHYNRKFNRDAVLLPLICGGTGIFGGLAVFSITGHMAYQMGIKDVGALMRNGPGLAFIAYPEALAQIPGAPIWTVLFFAMLITLGIDTQFATLETMTSGLMDLFPTTIGKHKILFTFLTCFVEFLLGLILVTRAGGYYFQVFDWYATPTSIIIIATLEVIVISYIYGAKKMFTNAETMLGPRTRFMRYFWVTLWYLVTPAFTVFIFITMLINYAPPMFTNGEPFPDWTSVFGWCLASTSIIPIPATALVEIYRNRHSLKNLLKPKPEWIMATAVRYESSKKQDVPLEDGLSEKVTGSGSI
uniref:Sodium:neurotransmitter symporter family protein n=1 Tax=Mesocestoides corti TaxID=53468 RepID=A0A5K3EXZ6_MESCO